MLSGREQRVVLILAILISQAAASKKLLKQISNEMVHVSKSFLRTVSENWIPWSPSGISRIPRPQRKPSPGIQLYHLHPFLWRPLLEIEISGGDVIVCHLSGGGIWRRTHWFLAINGYEMLHAHPWDEKHVAKIRADRRTYIPDRFMRTIDSSSCKNLGSGGYDRPKMIERAMDWNVRVVFYDETSCSSYHWVVYWVTGRLPRPQRYIPGFQKHLHRKCRLRTIVERPMPDDRYDHRWENPMEAFGPMIEEYHQGDDECGSSCDEEQPDDEWVYLVGDNNNEDPHAFA